MPSFGLSIAPPPRPPTRSLVPLLTNAPLTLSPAAGSIVFAGATPSLNMTITPAAGSIAFAGATPNVGGGVVPGAGSIVFAGSTPNVGGGVVPAAGSIVFAGVIPVLKTTTTPSAGAIVFAGATPNVGGGVVPSPGAIVFAGATAVVGGGVVPAAGSIVFAGVIPVLKTTTTPSAGAIVFSGATPALNQTVTPIAGVIIFGGGSVTVLTSFGRKGVRIDVYDVTGLTKVGAGPLVTISQVRYRYQLDQVGSATVTLSASDPQKSLLTGRKQLWIYVGAEGLVFRGKIMSRRATPYGQMELTLASVSEDLVVAKTGQARIFSAVSPSSFFSAILSGTGWTSGAIASVTPTFTKRGELKSDWAQMADAAKVYGGHVREDPITLSAGSPQKLIDFLAGGASASGLYFRLLDRVSPEMQENTTVFPLAALEELGDGRAIINRIYGLGPGQGYPMLTLQNSQHGANLDSDPCFLAGTTGWSVAGSGSIAQSTAHTDAIDGNSTHSALVSYGGSGGQYYAQRTYTISGATAGRVYTVRARFYGTGGTVGKTAFLQVNESGGAFGGDQGNSTTFTVVAGWQWVTLSRTVLQNDRTGIKPYLGINSGASAGETFSIRRIAVWDSTSYPYCVESEVGLGSVTEFFIEEPITSVATYGLLAAYVAVKDMTPTLATVAAYYAAINGMYDVCRRVMDQRSTEPVWYTAKPVGLKHVLAGAQLIKPGQSVRLQANAPVIDFQETAARAAFNIDATPTVMSQERTISTDGTDDWTIELSTATGGLAAQDDAEQLAELWDDFTGTQNDVGQDNFIFAYRLSRTSIDSAGTTATVLDFLVTDILSIQKATFQFVQLSAGASTIRLRVFWPDGSSPTTIADYATPTSIQSVDLTAYCVQSPTPVPWNSSPNLVRIQLQSVGAAGACDVEGSLVLQAVKLPVAPV